MAQSRPFVSRTFVGFRGCTRGIDHHNPVLRVTCSALECVRFGAGKILRVRGGVNEVVSVGGEEIGLGVISDPPPQLRGKRGVRDAEVKPLFGYPRRPRPGMFFPGARRPRR